MGYKSKKINRTKYLKNLSLKTQSNKKIYGGDINEKINASFNSNMAKIENLVVSIIANFVANSIQSIGTHLGADPNKPASESVKELSDTMTKIVNVLNTPEGENIKKEIGQLIAESFDIMKPSIAEGEQIFLNGIEKVSKTIKEMISTAINEIPPVFALTEASKFATAAAQTSESIIKLTDKGVNLFNNLQDSKDKGTILWNKITNLLDNVAKGVNNNVDKMITLGQDTIDNLEPNANLPNANLSNTNDVPNANLQNTNLPNTNLQNSLQNPNLSNANLPNTNLQNGLLNPKNLTKNLTDSVTDNFKKSLPNSLQNPNLQNALLNPNDFKKNLTDSVTDNVKNSLQNSLKNSLPNTNDLKTNFSNSLQQGGADLNQIYKERMIVGGRIKKSLLEFLYKEKSKTKRKNYYTRKLGSRSRKR